MAHLLSQIPIVGSLLEPGHVAAQNAPAPPHADFNAILKQLAPGILGATGGGISPQYIANLASSQATQMGTPGSSADALGVLQQLYPSLFGGS